MKCERCGEFSGSLHLFKTSILGQMVCNNCYKQIEHTDKVKCKDGTYQDVGRLRTWNWIGG